MKTILRVLLGLSICLLVYLCIMSVVTPISFENQRTKREPAVIANLIDIRTAANEFRAQNGRYTADMDSLLLFVKTAQKKEVLKEGALSDAQLEKGLTEAKAVKIIKRGNKREIEQNGLTNFKRDTIYTPAIEALYKGKYTVETIDQIAYIPYTDGLKYELKVNNEYSNKNGVVPLFQAAAHFNTYLGDLDAQELVNLIDKEEKLEHYPGLRVGNIDEPNNNAGNWE